VRATGSASLCRRSRRCERLAARGESLRGHTVRLLALLDDYGRQELAAAVAQALERDALGAGALPTSWKPGVASGTDAAMPLALPDRPGVRDLDLTRIPWSPTMSSPDRSDDPA